MPDPRQGSKQNARESTPDEPPEMCEYGDCERSPQYRVGFSDPDDFVYYCKEHKSMTSNYPGRRYATTC